MKMKQNGFVSVLVLFALAGGSAIGFTGAKAHENYMKNHPEQATKCITTDISTANSDCQLVK